MTDADVGVQAASRPWTCPFCPLLCDSFGVDVNAPNKALALIGSDCPRAAAALARFSAAPAPAQARRDGQPCTLDEAVDAAAEILDRSRQPLFGGLGTDVAGARALYALASVTGAISDAGRGAALMTGLRPLQDRGGFTTTLAEVMTRADLIVCLGGLPTVHYPEFFRRCGVGPGLRNDAQVVILGGDRDGTSRAAPAAATGGRGESLAVSGDLFDAVAALAACVAGPAPKTALAAIAALAARLQSANYAAIVHDTPRLPAHGALIVEGVGRIVAALNRRSRAAALPLGGDDGASTVNQVYAWLSGLPLRSRAGPAGLEHEPLQFDAGRLMSGGGVDALLWIASFGTEAPPPASALPAVVLGHPSFADADRQAVFIPVATPGIGAAGHLFRTDSSVLMPLRPILADGLPTVAEVVGRLTRALQARRTRAAA